MAPLVYDLGCGPGNSSELLLHRFPEADLIGVDTSEAMLAHARLRAPKARFVQRDIADWTPEAPPNLIFSNAALQFLPDHHQLTRDLRLRSRGAGCSPCRCRRPPTNPRTR